MSTRLVPHRFWSRVVHRGAPVAALAPIGQAMAATDATVDALLAAVSGWPGWTYDVALVLGIVVGAVFVARRTQDANEPSSGSVFER